MKIKSKLTLAAILSGSLSLLIFAFLGYHWLTAGVETLAEPHSLLLGLAAMVFLWSALYALTLQRTVSRTILRLGGLFERISENDSEPLKEIERSDEIGELARVSLKIMRRVRKSYDALRKEVAQRRRAEVSLRQSERRHRHLIETMNEGVAVLDTDQRLTYVNDKFCRILGYQREELLGRSMLDLIEQNEVRRQLRSLLAGDNEAAEGIVDDNLETTWRSGNGDQVFALVSPRLFYGDQGSPAGSFVVVTDITRRRQAELALGKEKERLAATLRSIGEGVIATDTEGRIVLMNQLAESMTGWRIQDALRQPVESVLQLLDRKSPLAQHRHSIPASNEKGEVENPIRRALATGVSKAMECRVQGGDQKPMIIALNGTPIFDAQEKIVGGVLVFRNVTAEKSWEEESRKDQKLESVGLLAGGVAHDFNNILTVVLGNVSLARTLLEPDSKVAQLMKETERASNQARYLTQQLLAFSKGGKPRKETVALSQVVFDAVDYVLRATKCKPRFQWAENLWPAEVDIGQINQVFQNLVINAAEAMPEGGVIRLSGENCTVLPDDPLPLSPGHYVRISVADRGRGIAEKDLDKVFDPYFTTKKSGAGLGLATAYSIVKKHDGYIGVVSELGKGTRFDVHLPARQSEIAKTRSHRQTEVVPGEGRVLIMEDDWAVRQMLLRMLHSLGYEAEAAEEGREAVDKFRAARLAGRPFDATILDLVVPGGKGGKETVKHILKIDQQAKVIVSSGYSEDPIMANYRDYGFAEAVAKPYDYGELSIILARVIGKPPKDA